MKKKYQDSYTNCCSSYFVDYPVFLLLLLLLLLRNNQLRNLEDHYHHRSKKMTAILLLFSPYFLCVFVTPKNSNSKPYYEKNLLKQCVSVCLSADACATTTILLIWFLKSLITLLPASVVLYIVPLHCTAASALLCSFKKISWIFCSLLLPLLSSKYCDIIYLFAIKKRPR